MQHLQQTVDHTLHAPALTLFARRTDRHRRRTNRRRPASLLTQRLRHSSRIGCYRPRLTAGWLWAFSSVKSGRVNAGPKALEPERRVFRAVHDLHRYDHRASEALNACARRAAYWCCKPDDGQIAADNPRRFPSRAPLRR